MMKFYWFIFLAILIWYVQPAKAHDEAKSIAAVVKGLCEAGMIDSITCRYWLSDMSACINNKKIIIDNLSGEAEKNTKEEVDL